MSLLSGRAIDPSRRCNNISQVLEAMAFSNLQAVFKLAQRPVHTISNRKGEEFELKTEAKGALLFLKDCTDCHASLLEKAAKVLVEDCNNLVLDVKNSLLSGLLELVSCKKVVLNLLEGGQVRSEKNETNINVKNLEEEERGWRRIFPAVLQRSQNKILCTGVAWYGG